MLKSLILLENSLFIAPKGRSYSYALTLVISVVPSPTMKSE